jgi:hypothetical protein
MPRRKRNRLDRKLITRDVRRKRGKVNVKRPDVRARAAEKRRVNEARDALRERIRPERETNVEVTAGRKYSFNELVALIKKVRTESDKKRVADAIEGSDEDDSTKRDLVGVLGLFLRSDAAIKKAAPREAGKKGSPRSRDVLRHLGTLGANKLRRAMLRFIGDIKIDTPTTATVAATEEAREVFERLETLKAEEFKRLKDTKAAKWRLEDLKKELSTLKAGIEKLKKQEKELKKNLEKSTQTKEDKSSRKSAPARISVPKKAASTKKAVLTPMREISFIDEIPAVERISTPRKMTPAEKSPRVSTVKSPPAVKSPRVSSVKMTPAEKSPRVSTVKMPPAVKSPRVSSVKMPSTVKKSVSRKSTRRVSGPRVILSKIAPPKRKSLRVKRSRVVSALPARRISVIRRSQIAPEPVIIPVPPPFPPLEDERTSMSV